MRKLKTYIRTFILSAFLFTPLSLQAVGWTPTDAGLVVNFEKGDQFLLSVMIDGTEYFVCDYPSYNGGKYNYKPGDFLKLVPQAPGATEPSAASIWTIGEPLTRTKNKISYPLGGIAYTMWGNAGNTLYAAESPTQSSSFKFLGYLTSNTNHNDLCDVVFAVPTNNETIESMDPDKTLTKERGRTDQDAKGKFNGQMGVGFAGMVYREVYWFDIPRSNYPESAYTNSALVTFNTTDRQKSWSNGQIKCNPGMAAYAFADQKHNATTRTVFRMYVLNKPFSFCSGYFFGWNVQNTLKYRMNTNNPQKTSDSTALKKIYTLDHFECMEHETVPDSSFFRTRYMSIPSRSDSTYFYVGYNNTYLLDDAAVTKSGSPVDFRSEFRLLSELRVRPLRDEATPYSPPKNAFGSVAIDSTKSSVANLDPAFEPAGYFLKVSPTGTNVEMQRVDDTTWISTEMWTISDEWAKLSIRATLFTGPEFSPADPGADIAGWSIPIVGNTVPLADGSDHVGDGSTGWARIHTNRPTPNGGMDFVEANPSKELVYDYQGLIGTALPKQYLPKVGGNGKVKVLNARLKEGFVFKGWATARGGDVEYWTTDSIGRPGKTQFVGDSITLTSASDTLYAVGYFNDTYRVAFSFIHPTDGKRYFLTHPGVAPRFARARTYTDWTDVYQGMSDEKNSEPNYLSTYKMIVNPVCEQCQDSDVVLDPRHETVHGVVDSLIFYEYWTPENDEYLGLYYTDPNTILANNTWAGIFKSTEGWPAYNRTAVDNTKLYSNEYFTGMVDRIDEGDGVIRKEPRPRLDYVKYNTTDNQFDGVATKAEGTSFQITGIAVADEHYVILPDTADKTTPWRNEITFGYHHNEPIHEQVWSKLIGKQLMAVLRVGPDTVYFHPNRAKTYTTANELRLSNDYRLTHAFEYIHDTRPDAAISERDSVLMEDTENPFCCNIHSGISSPMNVTACGTHIDIVDTLRVWLRSDALSKIKNYYGRWRDDQVDSVLPNGNRYRDILVKTKTFHYGDTKTELILTPKEPSYGFSALADQKRKLEFKLTKLTYRELLDVTGKVMAKDTLATKDTTSILTLDAAWCTLGSTTFTKVSAAADSVILKTTNANESRSALVDTLTVTIPANTYGTHPAITTKVPLIQASTQGDELVWSVVDPTTKKRYFIMAGIDGGGGHLIFREYNLSKNTLYKLGTTTALKKGAKNTANDDNQYITTWKYSGTNTLTLSIELPESLAKYFTIDGTGTIGDAPSAVTYHMVETYANDNANYEEVVKLEYGGTGTWLKFNGSDIVTTPYKDEASLFYWGYLLQEYELLNNGTYPSADQLVFDYNNTSSRSVTTRYKAYREYSMLLDNTLTYLCRENETGMTPLTNPSGDWKAYNTVELISDGRDFDAAKSSGLTRTTDPGTMVTTVRPGAGSESSPTNVTIDGKYVDIVDTLKVTLTSGRTDYRFKDWSGVSSLADATLKIPLVRKTYHSAPYDSITGEVEGDEYNYAFPSIMPKAKDGTDSTYSHTFSLMTIRRQGLNVMDADGHVVSYTSGEKTDLTDLMHLDNAAYAEIRMVDDYGKKPDWCEIAATGASTITIRCTKNGIRTPRAANLYFAYIIDLGGDYRYVNFKLTVSQTSLFQYANNQTLIHTQGASGDPLLADGRQPAHENKRILYYYNPKPYSEADQEVELPIRERGYYGWWRWYREGKDQNDVDVSDTDIPDSVWIRPPQNTGRYNFPFRIIGDSVKVPNPNKGKTGEPDSIMQLVTMGRYTVFHFPSKDYNAKQDPPSKTPRVMAPWNKDTMTYVVDISNYYDNLPLSMKQVNQIDTAVLDTMTNIYEPTLSIREAFELHPWTEMAEKLESFKDTIDSETRNLKYLEDHVVMAPVGNRLLLSTEQRYRNQNLKAKSHSESLLGYYMRDDNWATWADDEDRQDTMIWCGGWEGESECLWYTYNPSTGSYTPCDHAVTVEDDFLNVPAKNSLAGDETDTVYYCLRARSKATTGTKSKDYEDDATEDGLYMFNICRYKIIYHDPRKFGPRQETGMGAAAKAIITNDEIEQNYEVLERLNFDYVKPGKNYHLYPHPLPWGDGSYGYTYPVLPEIPNNRLHEEKDFPGPGEYGLINRIPYSTYWRKLEQHGGAENGYMIYCDGMSSAGQVAALSLETKLCEGQKMYFSGFVGNASSQSNKANPNFTISVQGSSDGATWHDITSYMTGDILPSNNWYQIFFPIEHDEVYDQFRVRIYNMASTFDGNDFIIDDLCVFATKPPLIAYQANTRCMDDVRNDSITHVVLRVDYQGFIDTLTFNNANIFYTVDKMTKDSVYSFVPMEDGYLNGDTIEGKVEPEPATPDTIYGYIPMPGHSYVPQDRDSIFTNIQQLVDSFDHSDNIFKKGYLYEVLDGVVRPVLYVIHKAKMTADNTYTVRMATGNPTGLMSSQCAMTSNLKVTNRMVLEINGEEVEEQEVTDMCANMTYDLALRIKGSLFLDSVAPLDVKGSCINDWLLYGDTSDITSVARYGYRYSDIRMLIRDILRVNVAANTNQFVSRLSAVNKNVLKNMQGTSTFTTPGHESDHPYDVLAHLVNNGFLTLYQSNLMATVAKNDSIMYVVFPIEGTGTSEMTAQGMEVCPTPLVIKLKPTHGGDVPLMVGGIYRDSTELSRPVAVLMNARTANDQFTLHIDSIKANVALHSVSLISTNDPELYEGVHILKLEPDKIYNFGGDNSGYYKKGNDITFRPATSNNYTMRAGYTYTFGIVMQSITGSLDDGSGCPVGTVPFTVSIVPDYLRWAPQSQDNNKWNDPDNWIGVDDYNDTIPFGTRFAPLPMTDVIIPAMTDGMPYPEIPEPGTISPADSVREVNFTYNSCDDIRFMPGAAMSQQQRLNCDVVVVDMTMPYDKWAFRSAPLTGMISGDLFMANADLNGATRSWSVGAFDANGRSYTTGNASYWLSVYSRETRKLNNNTEDSIRSADAAWSKVTNAMTQPLMPAQGWAVYTRTASKQTADIRLPKSDDIYYYFGTYGEQLNNRYEDHLRALRDELAGGTGKAGKLAYSNPAQTYTLVNDNTGGSSSFVFGNPTMGYIDIWGFIDDNCLREQFHYMDETPKSSVYTAVTRATADASTDQITNRMRYLPPMHAIVVQKADSSADNSLDVTLHASRLVTEIDQCTPSTRSCPASGGNQDLAQTPGRTPAANRKAPLKKGIMTITAVNPVSTLCTSHLLLGQGYHNEVLDGEDAVLMTICIDNFSMVNAPATPFNLYAAEGTNGLSIDLRDSIVNVPLSFYMSSLSFDPTTRLWFTGVNSIDGKLLFYDALYETETPIIDGSYIDIETPEQSHIKRYYIRRAAFAPEDNQEEQTTTGFGFLGTDNEQAVKIILHGRVFILRNGHIYTMMGQLVR